MYVLRLGLSALRATWGSATDLRPIADEVGAGVFKELDFHQARYHLRFPPNFRAGLTQYPRARAQEAANAIEFERRLSFLGFVRAPKWEPQYSGPRGRARVLAMEWVVGKRLSQLEPEAQLRMVNMAVQASVAQLVRTGFVHADPHAGNLLLDPDGKLVFLDFGLMCRVEPYIMEAFASGICHLLAGDWQALAYDFRDIGLAPKKAFEKRNPETGVYEPCEDADFADGVKRALLGEEDGLTRFGALATGLGGLSGQFRFLCPPFIILLCRTFLTLEGMADVVDPNFSIYTQARGRLQTCMIHHFACLFPPLDLPRYRCLSRAVPGPSCRAGAAVRGAPRAVAGDGEGRGGAAQRAADGRGRVPVRAAERAAGAGAEPGGQVRGNALGDGHRREPRRLRPADG